MPVPIEVEVYIDDVKLESFYDLKITEKMGDHATFELLVNNDTLKKARGNENPLENSQTFLNKSIQIQTLIQDRNNHYKPLRFFGIVVQVAQSIGFRNEAHDKSKISGFGASIVLDDGPHMDSFDEMALSEIIDEVTRHYQHPLLKVNIAPERDITIPYTVQQMESGFEYLKRMAANYGEYLCYAEDTLHFGKPDFEEVVLIEAEDLIEYRIGLNPQSQNFKYYASDYKKEETVTSDSTRVNTSNAYLHNLANNASQELYGHSSIRQQQVLADNTQQALDTLAELQHKVIEQQQVSVQGVSDNPGVGLGKPLSIQSREGNELSYRVSQVTHTFRDMFHYQNEFTAISRDIDIYPHTDINLAPQGSPEIATVTDTSDIAGISRIRVQYAWQKTTGKKTPWIRMATPYAGAGRGMHFIPEIGDQVVTGYELNNKNLPYVQSALYTGVNKHNAWQSQNNDYKGITTKSGHSIELRDTKGGEMITITDKNSNMIQLDTNGSSIVISAPENLILQAKNIDVRATENIRVSAGKNKMNTIGGNYMLEASNIFESASEEFKSKADEIVNQAAADISITSSGGNVNKNANGKVNNNSGEQGNLF